MLYLLCFFGFDVLYLLLGAVYMMKQMFVYNEAWDNFVWLLWPILMWREWRLACYIKRQNKKWEN